MNTTKQNLVWASILLASAVLRCRRAGEDVDRTIVREIGRKAGEQAGRTAVHAALEEATKKRVVESLEYAA